MVTVPLKSLDQDGPFEPRGFVQSTRRMQLPSFSSRSSETTGLAVPSPQDLKGNTETVNDETVILYVRACVHVFAADELRTYTGTDTR